MADKPVPAAPLATPEEVAARRKEQESEYGTYVALTPITFNGALAYNPGDPVPASNVARFKYDDQGLVAKVTTKAAADVVTRVHEAGQQQVLTELPPPVSLGVVLPENK